MIFFFKQERIEKLKCVSWHNFVPLHICAVSHIFVLKARIKSLKYPYEPFYIVNSFNKYTSKLWYLCYSYTYGVTVKMYNETEGVLEGGYYILTMSKNGEIVQY